ncbi:LysR family transcriptional regulator [Roseomonas sp. E05]|uniref:LysR family transcriptional regulator n=1 Tax=Roseomonas sp. E05 TaxID=3046310 RepID=UPI0024B8E250|nr:LysR family transcriptional regulator [Roseomonas sp. E05]MDJ0387690.1 LysR family transcriptional regulator [Roseomonas sp. E05]
MNKFLALTVFTKVAEHGGFTAAARRLGLSVSAVTKTVARLEDDLGTQLFNRTTRQLHTTDYGQEFYERCIRILADLEDAETALRQGSISYSGRVRVITPFSFGRVTLVPELPSFLRKYPEIVLDLNFSDQPVDLIAEGYDVAVRTGEISDSRLTTRLLTRGSQVTFAAPSYLARHGTPRAPEDLRDHNCIVGRFGPEWSFRGPDRKPMTVRVSGNAVVNSGDALREAAVAGIGIGQGTWWLVRKDLERGLVDSILPDYAPEGMPISILYPAQRHLPAKVRIFIDFLVAITRTS